MQTQTTTTQIGILLPCPICGEQESSIRVHMEDGTFSCAACENEFGQDTVRTIIKKWTPVLKWMESMPNDEE